MFSTKVPKGRCAAHVAYLPVGPNGEVRKVSLKDNEVYVRLADGSTQRLRTRKQIREAERAGRGPVLVGVASGSTSFFPSNEVAAVQGSAAAAGMLPGDEVERLTLLDADGNVIMKDGKPLSVGSSDMAAMREMFAVEGAASFRVDVRRDGKVMTFDVDAVEGEVHAGIDMPFAAAMRASSGGYQPVGLPISGVTPGSAAEAAGLVSGDTLVGVDGEHGLSGAGILDYIRSSPGQELGLVVRDAAGEIRVVSVTPEPAVGEDGGEFGLLGTRSPSEAIPSDFLVMGADGGYDFDVAVAKGERVADPSLARRISSYNDTFGVAGSAAAEAAAPPSLNDLKRSTADFYGTGERVPVSDFAASVAEDGGKVSVLHAALSHSGAPLPLEPEAEAPLVDVAAAAVMLLRSRGVDPVDSEAMMARLSYVKLSEADYATRERSGAASADSPLVALERAISQSGYTPEEKVAQMASWIADAASPDVSTKLGSGIANQRRMMDGKRYSSGEPAVSVEGGAAVLSDYAQYGETHFEDFSQTAYSISPVVVGRTQDGAAGQFILFDSLSPDQEKEVLRLLNNADPKAGWSASATSSGRGFYAEERSSATLSPAAVAEIVSPYQSGVDAAAAGDARLRLDAAASESEWKSPSYSGVAAEFGLSLSAEAVDARRLADARSRDRSGLGNQAGPEARFASGLHQRHRDDRTAGMVPLVRVVDSDGETDLAHLSEFSARAFLIPSSGETVVSSGAVLDRQTAPERSDDGTWKHHYSPKPISGYHSRVIVRETDLAPAPEDEGERMHLLAAGHRVDVSQRMFVLERLAGDPEALKRVREERRARELREKNLQALGFTGRRRARALHEERRARELREEER